jgi:hypothetical protein
MIPPVEAYESKKLSNQDEFLPALFFKEGPCGWISRRDARAEF